MGNRRESDSPLQRTSPWRFEQVMNERRKSRAIRVGSVQVGGGAPVSIQSMTNSDTRDTAATLEQISCLAEAGCEIVRVTLPSRDAVDAFGEICAASPLPVIADIHFNHRLALAAIAHGAAGVRINPGNIGGKDGIAAVTEAAGAMGIPIRVGVNSGSLEPEILARYGAATAEALVESALGHCRMLEEFGFRDIKVSIKASDVTTTVCATRLFAARTDYPLHLGITEAGARLGGIVKSSVGIGALLLDGIGDTIRVSLTAPPEEEIRVAIRILEAAGLRTAHPEIVACPTCGRCGIDLIGLVQRVEDAIEEMRRDGYTIPLRKVAIMGCVVNGPGEARDADLGIAGEPGGGVLFRKGVITGRVREDQLFDTLMAEIRTASRKETK